MKTAIIPARFQNGYLHDAHVKLIKHAMDNNERVIVFAGQPETRLTTNNPLPFEARKKMILELFDIEVFPMPDFKYDDIWVKELDKRIDNIARGEEITLYGSRDSFINCYEQNGGYFKVEMVHDIVIENLSSSVLRQVTHKEIKNGNSWREGIVFASAYKYPVSYQTVDIAIIDSFKNRILLGKKKYEKKFRFIGGHVDVADSCLEEAAKREVIEEAGYIETANYKYICSTRIDDWRYRKSKDKIMTTFFYCNYIFGHSQASDDICDVQWFQLKDLTADIFEPEHIVLFNELEKYLIKIN